MAQKFGTACLLILLEFAFLGTASADDFFSQNSIWQVASDESGVPADLIYAVALAESKKLHSTETMKAWPWTLGVDGKGYWFKSKSEAVTALKKFIADGTPLWKIDIGFTQLNAKWTYKKRGYDKIYEIEDLLEPAINVGISARILSENIKKGGITPESIGSYHSSEEPARSRYGNEVIAMRDRVGIGSKGSVQW